MPDEIPLEVLLADHQLYHSEFQMDHFITYAGGGRTLYGQYKQALRELYKRVRALRDLRLQAEILELDVEDLETTWRWSSIARRRDLLEIARKRDMLEELAWQIQETEREERRFRWQAGKLKQKLGEISAKRRAVLEEELWISRIKFRAALEKLLLRGISLETGEMIMALPADLRADLLEDLKEAADLKEWLESTRPQLFLEDEKEDGNADRIQRGR